MTAGLPRTRRWRDARTPISLGKLFLVPVAALPIGPGKIL
jgi:hypothetical protein